MSAMVYREEPGKIASGLMAIAVHIAFFVLLIIGVSWQQRPPSVSVVELWNNLPPVPAVKAPTPEPAPKAEIKPPPAPPPAEVKPQPKLEFKPAPEPKPIVKPDIALEKEKQDKVRREREEREKVEARKKDEAKKREETAKAEARKKDETERQKVAALEADRAAKDAERVRLEREQQEALKRLQQQQAAAQSSARKEFEAKIMEKIRRYIVLPPDIKGNPQADFEVILLPTGDVLRATLKKSSQHAAYDRAVERAILRAQPLPVPTDPGMFKDFRELNLQFRPNE